MNDQSHTEGNKDDENENSGFSDDVSRRGMIQRVGTVGAIAAAGGISLAVGTVRAQSDSETVWSDDFEDGDIDGWSGQNISIATTATLPDQTYSLEATDDLPTQLDNPEWSEGPILDLNEEFTVRGTTLIDQGNGNDRVGQGLIEGEENQVAFGIILVESAEYGSTFIGESVTEDPAANNLDTINNDFDTQWVNFEIYTEGGGTIEAKVWEVGSTEPTGYQLSRDMDPTSGPFSLFLGTADQERQQNLDEIEITGVEAESEFLEINTRDWLARGQRYPYTVSFTNEETGDRTNVTEDSTVTSADSDVVSVDETNHELVATEDEDVNERVTIRAEYSEADEPALHEVTVADISMENIDILPPWRRIQATFGDSNIKSIIVAIFAGVAGSHLATSFAGLGFATIVCVVLWFGGYLETGFAMVALFLSLFIGLNLAANIDYTMQR